MDRVKLRACLPASLALVLMAGSLFWATPADAGHAPILVTTEDDELNEDGDCSLREAVQAANTNAAVDACAAGSESETDVIDLPFRGSGGRVKRYQLTREVVDQDDDTNLIGDLDVTGPTIIDGQGRVNIDARAREGDRVEARPPTCTGMATVKVGNNSRVLHVLTGASLTVDAVEVRGGYASASGEDAGGGILNEGSLVLEKSLVVGNFVVPESDGGETVGAGGGIAESPSATSTSIVDTDFSKNGVLATSSASGGGAWLGAPTGDRTLTSNLYIYNGVCADVVTGGGIAHHAGESTISHTRMWNNSLIGKRKAKGGGLANLGASSTVEFVDGNSMENHLRADVNFGAGIYNGGALIFDSSEVLRNASLRGNSKGAGIYNKGSLVMRRSAMFGNGADRDRFRSGSPAAAGGGLHSPGSAEITNSTLLENEAEVGGGIFVPNGGDVELMNVTLFGNRGHEAAGGIAVKDGGHVTLRNSIVAYSTRADCLEFEETGITSVAYNLDTDGTCGLTSVGDMPDADPGLVFRCPGCGRGGHAEVTRTMVPREGSPVIDVIPEGGEFGCPPPSNDQRGVERPVDGDGDGTSLCDIGAGERTDSDPRGTCPGYEDDPRHQIVGNESRTIYGTPAPEILCGYVMRNWIYGREGNDLILGADNGDVIVGGEGDDVIWARGSKDWVSGGPGADVIRGGGDEDLVYGGNARDRILGGRHADQISGNAGDDELFGGAGFDSLSGGPDVDRCVAGPDGASKQTCEGPERG